jgi:hypothetical protein
MVEINEMINLFDEINLSEFIEEEFVCSSYLKGIRVSENPFIVDGVLIGLPFNLQDLINKYGKELLPNCLGIYHLFYNDQLIYIGMSKNLRGRLLCHLKDKDMPFNNVLWFCANVWKKDASIQDVLNIEHKMIKKFKPSLNSVHANCR